MECNSSLCEIVTQTIFPFLGMLTSYFIFFSPFKEIEQLRRNRGPCTINPIPSVMIVCNCLCWNLYSFVIHNPWTFWPNIGGILLGEYYVMVLVNSEIRQKDFNMATFTLIAFTFLNIAGASFSFIFMHEDFEAAKNCMGIVCIIVLCAMYASPLTTMAEVIQTKNSSSINILMTIASFANGFLWLVYGIFFNDFYVWFPNCIGVVSSLIQAALFVLYHRPPRRNSEDLPICNNEENSPTSEPSTPNSITPLRESTSSRYN